MKAVTESVFALRVLGNNPDFQALYESVEDFVAAPIYAESHEDGARAIVLGDFYNGTNFPDIFQNSLFFQDYEAGFLKTLVFDEQGNVDSVVPVAGSPRGRGITYMAIGPDSNLYFSNIETGEVGYWDFIGIKSESGFSISGQVRNDIDGDADFSDPDEGISGVTITLFLDSIDNPPIATTTTDSNGEYIFDGLQPGDYFY